MINDIFWDLIAEDIVVVYLDDIFIFTRTIEEYMRAIWRVLKILVEHKLFLHLEKCKFQKEWIKYLDLVISENKVSIDPIKITRVCEWLIPKNRTNVQAFLGFINFYRQFIQDFLTMAYPLFDLTWANQVWTWIDKKYKVFDALKQVVTSAPVLVLL